MANEVSSIDDDREALRWALGCFVAAQKLGLRTQLRTPSAFLPLLMSIAALGLVLGHFALYGIVYQPDEGTPAHLFQLLMVAQLPFMAFSVLRWLPRAPGPAIQILALQAGAACAAITSVLYLT
jgi:hypothetical protein